MNIMEKPKRKRYDETFKRACVESLVSSGKPLKEVSRWNLRDWQRR